MLLKLRLLVLVDEAICDYEFMKRKLNKLTIEVARLELVTDNHWGSPVRWFDERWRDYRNSLTKKVRLDVNKSSSSYSYYVFQRIAKEPDKKRRKRIKSMVKFSDNLIIFWDTTNIGIERVVDKAKQLGKPCREYLL